MEWRELLAAAASIVVTSIFVWNILRKRKTKEKTDASPTVFPDKQTTLSPDISARVKDDKDVNDKSYINPAYRENDPHTSPSEPVQATSPPMKVESEPKERNVSDVSEVFRPPSPDKKSLSDIMIERYDRKSKKLRSQGSEDQDDQSDIAHDDEIEGRKNPDTSVTNQTLVDGTFSDKKDKPADDNILPISFPRHAPTNKSTEWRDKLKFDLDDDDDIDSIDETSEEEKSDENFLDEEEAGSDDDDDSLENEKSVEEENNLTKSSSPGGKNITSDASTNKLLNEIPIVIDNGSYIVRGGWGGEFTPTTCAKNVIGSWRAEASEAWQKALGSKFFGQTAIDRHATLALEHPIEDGKINDWRGVQDVLRHVVEMEMNADMTQHPVLITEPANVDKKQREKMVEVMMESVRTAGLCLKSQAALCTLPDNHPVGLVINCGYGVTEIVPVYYGYALPYATTTLAVGGRHITEYLIRLAQRERGYSFTSVAEIEIINSIKENHATVSAGKNVDKLVTNSLTECPLPDGRVMQFGNELFTCTEPLFSPGLVGCPAVGVTSLIKQTLNRLDPDLTNKMSNTLLLCGGNSNLTGLESRLKNDLASNLNGITPRLKRTSSGNDSAWLGGSLFSKQPDFINACITEDIYFEHGAQVVHRLCL